MPLDKVVWTCLALLFFSSAGSLGCLQHCNQTKFVIPNETEEIVLPGCKQCTKQCTKNCTHCSLQNQEIVQAWWFYYNHDGTRMPDQNGFANRSSNYSINVTRWWGESGDHYITANYKYLCKNKPEHRNGWAVHNIEIKLRVLDVNINCTDETPIQEGMIVNLQCLAGLPYTLDLKEEFHFNDQNWTCDSLSNAHERSSERKHTYRNSEQNYNCELEISNAQTSDSGYYECSVSLPGHDSPVMSRGLHLQVQSAGLSTSRIFAYGASGVVLLALILLAVAAVVGAYRVYKRPHRGDPERQCLIGGQQPRPQAGQQPRPQAGQQPRPQAGQQPQPQAGQPPQILHQSGGQQHHGVDVSGGNPGAIDSGSSKRDIFFSAQEVIRP